MLQVPSFARAVAAELRSASDRAAAGFADPPADAEAFAFTSLAAFPAAADAEDPAAAEALLARALAVCLLICCSLYVSRAHMTALTCTHCAVSCRLTTCVMLDELQMTAAREAIASLNIARVH